MDSRPDSNTFHEIIEMMREQNRMVFEYRNMMQNYSQMCNNYYSYVCQYGEHISQVIHRLYPLRESSASANLLASRNSTIFPMPSVNSLSQVFGPTAMNRSIPPTQLRRHPFRAFSSPIQVMPTNTDLFSASSFENNTRRLNETDISNTTYTVGRTTHTVCPIGLDDFVEGEEVCIINGCGHVFKRENLERWLTRNTVCPVCRYDIINRQPAANVATTADRDTMEFIFDIDLSGNVIGDNNQYQNLRQVLYNIFSRELGIDNQPEAGREGTRSRFDAEVIVDSDSDSDDNGDDLDGM